MQKGRFFVLRAYFRRLTRSSARPFSSSCLRRFRRLVCSCSLSCMLSSCRRPAPFSVFLRALIRVAFVVLRALFVASLRLVARALVASFRLVARTLLRVVFVLLRALFVLLRVLIRMFFLSLASWVFKGR